MGIISIGTKAPLTERTPTGTMRHYSRWKLIDGTIIETPMTEAEYLALGKKGAGEPNRAKVGIPKSAVWILSASMTEWDTPDKKLGFGDYSRSSDGVLIGIDEINPVFLRKTKEELMIDDVELSIKDVPVVRIKDGLLEKL